MKARRREVICKYLLLVLLTLSLTAALLQSARPKPYQLYGTLGLLWDVELIPIGGMQFPLTQLGCSMSGPLAWIVLRICGLPYQIGLLLLPAAAFVGCFLLHNRVEFGRTLMLLAIIPNVPIVLILFVISLMALPFAENTNLALQQAIYYFGMVAIPTLELILLHGWMQNRSNKR